MMGAEYFDILGVGAFLFFLIFSLYSYFKIKKFPKWLVILAIVISLAGLIVDSYVVIGNFLIR